MVHRLIRILLVAYALMVTAVQATVTLLIPGDDVIGQLRSARVANGDTLVALARRYNVGYHAMLNANPQHDIWLPAEGTRVQLPTVHILPSGPREGIVLNLAEMRLYYYPENLPEQVWTYPVGIGRQGWQTPVMSTRIESKHRDPTWYPPESIRKEALAQGEELPKYVPPGPDNPLGAFSLRLDRKGYLLHGTNRPAGVGMQVSHGCVRLYPEDIEQLFNQIKPGTPVRVIDELYKIGWRGDDLWLEVHPRMSGESQVSGSQNRSIDSDLIQALIAATPNQKVAFYWSEIAHAVKRANGIPLIIGRRMARPDGMPEAP